MNNEQVEPKRHLSYSELVQWVFCSHYHKCTYLDKIPISNYDGPVSAGLLGTAMHSVCEKTAKKEILTEQQQWETFLSSFNEAVSKLETETDKQKFLDEQKMIEEHTLLWKEVFPEISVALEAYFGPYVVIDAERRLYEPVGDGWHFKGYIDLVVRDSKGVYHIIDFKTTSWGWKPEKKSDKMVTYQLTLYKIFLAKQLGIDPSIIETHFALLKRTAKPGKHIEIFRVTSGAKKMQNAIELFDKALYNIKNQRYIKNRMNCSKCKLHHSEWCC